jgi:hypothetical protein
VLSILMAIFLWCLLLSGPPRLAMSDGFAIFDRYDLYPEVIWIGLSSAAITFVMHMTCVWLFRFVLFLFVSRSNFQFAATVVTKKNFQHVSRRFAGCS